MGDRSTRRVVRLAAGAGRVTSGATSGIVFRDHGGPVFDRMQVHLVFWGSAWGAGASPSADQVQEAVARLLASSYTSALNQYRGIAAPTLHGSTVAAASEPPSQFTNDDVSDLLSGLIGGGTVPEPDEVDQLLYCVILPPGVASRDSSLAGEHAYFLHVGFDPPFDVDAGKAYYAWVTNDGTLDGITTILSHELVESATDPEGSAVLGDPGVCSAAGWCEIGDVCEGMTGSVDGVAVQAYWSQEAGLCVIPG